MDSLSVKVFIKARKTETTERLTKIYVSYGALDALKCVIVSVDFAKEQRVDWHKSLLPLL
jgi:quercetin dioxygenase-like cupin family protein